MVLVFRMPFPFDAVKHNAESKDTAGTPVLCVF